MGTLMLTDVDGLTAADVMHRNLSYLPASTTVGEVRAYFAQSSSRRLALFVDDDERFAGGIEVDALPATADADAPALGLASPDPQGAPDAPAGQAGELALAQGSRRCPVVDGDGRLVGVVAIDKARTGFCGT